ncbi:MAG: polyprenyl synthetase family protein [Bacteroidales bacterium]
MNSIETYTEIINKALSGILYTTEPSGLYTPIKYQLDMGGKRVRPLLAVMACDALGGDISEVIQPAIGIEIFHNFTLLHDDVMDKADIRRGRPTVHKAWSENVAILSGDAMQIIAYQKIGETPRDRLKEVLCHFTEIALEICEGQQYDMEFEMRSNVTEEEYIEMIRLKTAVLMGCALKIGAIVARASQAEIEALYRFGENLGMAFQLQDDYLDVYGDPIKFGKNIGGDILNNKKTYMLISACRIAAGAEKEELLRLLQTAATDPNAKIKAVTAIYTKLGIDHLARQKMDLYYQNAIKELDIIPDNLLLKRFSAELMQRQS